MGYVTLFKFSFFWWNLLYNRTFFISGGVIKSNVVVNEILDSNHVANIIGGQNVSINSTLYLSYAIPTQQRSFCGATLIWDDVLLSAAHCKTVFNVSNQSVMIGGTFIDGSNAIDKNIPILDVVAHPNFKDATVENVFENDIMLIFLNETGQRAPISQFNANPTVPADNSIVTVIGHGKADPNVDETTFSLKQLNLTVTNFFACDALYDILDIEVHLCATDVTELGAPCNGDSGGPLFYNDTIVGLVSFGFCTDQPYFPTVFTRVSMYNDWILTTICQNSIRPPTKDMCDGIVPLRKLPPPTSPPSTLPPIDDTSCKSRFPTTEYNLCKSFIFFSGVYVHKSIFGLCIKRCSIFPRILLILGWRCGECNT
jgi:trypsin